MPTYESLPVQSPFFKGNLYEKLIQDLRLAGKAKRTVYGYVRAVRKLAEFHRKAPDKITEQEVRRYLLHLIVEREVAAGTQSVALSGIKFFYRTTCPRKWKVFDQTKINYVNALPEVITQAQVFQLIDACQTLRMKTFLWTSYTLGLRIGEAVNLQIGDLDSQRMMVHVHRGKVAKDRYLPLPVSTLSAPPHRSNPSKVTRRLAGRCQQRGSETPIADATRNGQECPFYLLLQKSAKYDRRTGHSCPSCLPPVNLPVQVSRCAAGGLSVAHLTGS